MQRNTLMRHKEFILITLVSMMIISCDNSSGSSTSTETVQATNGETESRQIGEGANLVPIPEFASSVSPLLSDGPPQQNGGNRDCLNTVPCTWTDASQQATVTITRADNTATRSRLAIDYKISTLHDTNLLITQSSDPTLSNESELSSSELIFAGDSVSSPHPNAAGEEIAGTVIFGNGTNADFISSWQLSFLDSGIQRTASFSSVPIGTRARFQADCESTLPCSWTDEKRSIDVTLLKARAQQGNEGIVLTFAIRTQLEETVFVVPGSTAVATDDTVLEALEHSLNGLQSLDELSSVIEPGTQLMGSIAFLPTATPPEALDVLQLKLHNDSTDPHWNPRFINVPLNNESDVVDSAF